MNTTKMNQIRQYIKYIKEEYLHSASDGKSGILSQGIFLKALRIMWDKTPQEVDPSELRNKTLSWNAIQKTIHPHNTNHRLRIYAYAASLIILIMGSSIGYLLTKESDTMMMNIQKVGHRTTDLLHLPDGTKVILGTDSRISYPSEFDGKRREVELSGQAFFYVTKSENQPFVVKTKQMDIEVLGTEFEVFSYETDNIVEATLLSGKIEVKSNASEGKKFTLSPNERIVLKPNNEILIDTINADDYTSWRNNGVLSFSNQKLEWIIPRLEKWYGISITCPRKIAEHYQFTFTLHDETLEQLLDVLTLSSPIAYRRDVRGNVELSLKQK